MSKYIKVVIISFLLLSFVSQAAVVSSMPFTMDMGMPQDQVHSGHHLMESMGNTGLNSLDSSFDCCQQDCNCSMAGCSLAMLDYDGFSAKVIPSQAMMISLSTAAIHRFASSRYRPPITR